VTAPLLRPHPELEVPAFRVLVKEWAAFRRALGRTSPDKLARRFGPDVLPLLVRAVLVHQEQPFPEEALRPMPSADLMAIGKHLAVEFGHAHRFIPKGVRAALVKGVRYDPGRLAGQLEPFVILFLARCGEPFADVVIQVELYSLGLELWRRTRQEQLRRLRESPVGVLLFKILDEEPAALAYFNRRYLGREVAQTFTNAVRWAPSIVRDPTEAIEEANAERNLALAENLASLGQCSWEERVGRVMDRDPALRYAPASIHRDGQDLLRHLQAQKRTLPEGGALLSTDHPPTPDSRVTFGDLLRTKEPDPEAQATETLTVERILEVVTAQLGPLAARIVAAFLEPGGPRTREEVAAVVGCSVKTVSRTLKRLAQCAPLRDVLRL
jgi:hypothetical protein